MHKIREGARWFHQEVFPLHRRHFAALEKGQAPEVLFLTCSDSRVDPAQLTQTRPGDLFVIRNAGNFVPVDQEGDGVIASIEFGVEVLGVEFIVVCGHSHCGAVAAALDPASAVALPAVTAWLHQAGPDLRDFEPESTDRPLAAVRHNVRHQLAALSTIPCVARAVAAGRLELHGWVYRFEVGEVEELDPVTDCFASLNATGSVIPNPVA